MSVPARSDEPRWASLKEAEIYSHIPRRTLRHWIAKGWLPAERVGPRLIRVDLDDVDRLRTPIPSARLDAQDA